MFLLFHRFRSEDERLASKITPRRRKRLQHGPKMAPRSPKMAPGWAQDGPKTAPRRPQDGSKTPPRSTLCSFLRVSPPRTPQDAPKTPPRGPETPPGALLGGALEASGTAPEAFKTPPRGFESPSTCKADVDIDVNVAVHVDGLSYIATRPMNMDKAAGGLRDAILNAIFHRPFSV